MRRLLLLAFILLPLTAFAAEMLRGPYVEDPTLNTAIVRFQTDVPSAAWLEYGPVPKCDQIMAVSSKTTNHQFILHGLVANKEFCYRAYIQNNAGDGVQNPVRGTFRTLYSPERKVIKFVIFGNTAGGGELTAKLAEKAAVHNPDFYIHTGDLVSTGLSMDADKEFFTPLAPLLTKAPMFITVGEKEYGLNKSEAESRSFFRTNYMRLHGMTWGKGSPNYYYFDTASARFIFLDTSAAAGAVHAPSIAKDSPQYVWLKNALAYTESGRWKVVIMHRPAYSTGVQGGDLSVREAFSGLFEYYGVNAVFQGDDHNYERTFPVRAGLENPKGVPYITFGSGASQELGKRVFKDDWTARFYSGQAYGVGEIVDRKLTIKVYTLDDKLLETVEIYQ